MRAMYVGAKLYSLKRTMPCIDAYKSTYLDMHVMHRAYAVKSVSMGRK